MKEAVGFLIHDAACDVPAQNLSISHTRMPALPQSGFVMEKLRPVL
jgi:hypothetical protein